MALRVVFLGKLADLAGAAQQDLPIAGDEIGWDEFLAALNPAVAATAGGERVRVALNGAIVGNKTGILARDGDEIALLPPVSGG